MACSRIPGRFLLTALTVAAATTAQVERGHALVCWKPANVATPGGLILVDRTGTATPITGLAAATIGTQRHDGAQSVVVTDDGTAFVGLGVDNSAGNVAVPLSLRVIALRGAAVVADAAFAVLHQVPAGEIWHVSDLAERPDGRILVAITQIATPLAPLPQSLGLSVDRAGVISLLPGNVIPSGELVAIADAGDSWIGAYRQSAPTAIEIWSFDYDPAPPSIRVVRMAGASTIGALATDVDRTIVAALPFGTASLVRMPITIDAAMTAVPNSPPTITVGEVLPASGQVVAFARPTPAPGALLVADTLAGGFVVWSPAVVNDPVDVSVRKDAERYGPWSSTTDSRPWLGTHGGWPVLGNGSYGLRLGGAPAAPGLIVMGTGRALLATPFGILLVDPSRLLVLGAVTAPGRGETRLPLPLPADPTLAGTTAALQSVLVDVRRGFDPEMSPGLAVTLLPF